jgi:hypothetical protein
MKRTWSRQIGLTCVVEGCERPAKVKSYCLKHRHREYRIRNPEITAAQAERALNVMRRKKYGIGNDDVMRMVAEQGGCAACHATEPGGRGTWHVDHDHKTSVVRGILCHGCNVALGHVEDSVERLQALAAYLTDAYARSKHNPATRNPPLQRFTLITRPSIGL